MTTRETTDLNAATDIVRVGRAPAAAKKPKKDHACPHDRKYPSGMEVCRICGDLGTCPECGDTYIKLDTGSICYPCAVLRSLQYRILAALKEQQQRRAANGLEIETEGQETPR
jgi:hypothetical protein